MSVTRVGAVRPSQLLYTYGPGALVDLPHLSVVVRGLGEWSTDPAVAPEVVERRLLAAVRRRPTTAQVVALRFPPYLEETSNLFDDWSRTGVPVRVFPQWLRCPACDRMAPIDSGLFTLEEQHARPDRTMFRHTNCSKAGKAPPAVPVRFLLACRNGHLDDFPWIQFTHRGPPCDAPILRMLERGLSTATADILVQCTNCDVPARSMAEAFGESAERSLPACRGRHPHLGIYEDCDEHSRAMLLGASNQWFSVSERVFSLPVGATPLAQLVEECWPALAPIDSPGMLGYALEQVPALAPLKGSDPDEIWKEIERRRGGDTTIDEGEDLLAPEWEQFANPASALRGPDFQLREVAVPERYQGLLASVVLAERLREVVALCGYTRIDPPGEIDVGGHAAPVGPLMIGASTWVPCSEVRGEGVFLRFREEVIEAWSQRVAAAHGDFVDELRDAHRRWRIRRNLDPALGWPGLRYLALHSFSHLLVREFALECGYGAASLSERTYASDGTDGRPPMAGILVYTAAPDSEGTLGGLVSLGEPDRLEPLLAQALARASMCSSDPICAEHVPGPEEDVLHAAACHACLFVPETACERSNRYLDRSLVVDTFGNSGRGLFAP